MKEFSNRYRLNLGFFVFVFALSLSVLYMESKIINLREKEIFEAKINTIEMIIEAAEEFKSIYLLTQTDANSKAFSEDAKNILLKHIQVALSHIRSM